MPLTEAFPFPAAGPPAMRRRWEAEFSRHFIFLRRNPSAGGAAALRPIRKDSSRFNKGSWLTASSPATILIVKDRSSDVAVLSVFVSGYKYEEHVVSSLHLTWPQVGCVPLCPIRGSRVVFVSYTDCSNQIQKFVVRFPTCTDAETFICFFKDCSRDIVEFAYPSSDLLCDSSSLSEMIASNALQYKINEDESYEEAITKYMPPAFSEDKSHRPSPLLISSNNTIFSALPPSFTELLTNCSKYPLNETNKQPEEANHTLWSGDCSRDIVDFAHPASDFLCDSSSPSEMIASNALQYKINEDETYEEAITRNMPSSAFGEDESHRPSPLLISSNNTPFSALPPTFTELLAYCSKYPPNDINKQPKGANNTFWSGEIAPPLSPQNVVTEQPTLEANIKNEIARYMSDASFYDLVVKVEKVVQELGGDLLL